ncbi:MAG: tRNA preQ1(34) S-adenosylmethionine ribosyltransferase-isomerase QueA [Gammaproteobacteria bacterium]|nr:tRNA preQ1(34) S-adenosylmethionine ribosyltransferase-isomerase QueA [Gammaproteobacteria bacterium]
MQTSDFSYQLPDDLIAYFPPVKRGDSKLLCLDRNTGEIGHKQFGDLLDFLQGGDLLIFNDTRVIPARLYGRKETGGKIELLIERILDGGIVLTQLKSSKSPKTGSRLLFPSAGNHASDRPGNKDTDNPVIATVLGREEGFYRLEFQLDRPVIDYLEKSGHMPLPPYIKRQDLEQDRERYQTVYNEVPGAVAAPTAGLHFDEAMMQRLDHMGIEKAFITLHVGAGTFQPVRVEDVESHRMHSEWVEVSTEVVDKINRCKQRRGRVIAIGTTTVRSLESAAADGTIKPFQGETEIFIYPGFEFKVIDAMVTNFHLPESTLLMLVSAFAGKEKILDAYHSAILHRYRFFSYGDAMFIF